MSKVFVCAHRGASNTHPENTLEAFHEAMRLGCEMIEFDVRATKDGYLILLHDPLIDRTTNANGPIWEMLYSDVTDLQICFKNTILSDSHIPTLNEALDTISNKTRLNIHIYPGPEGADMIVEGVCSAVSSRDLYETAFIAGTDDVMESVIRIDKKMSRCLLGSQGRIENYAQKAKEYGCSSIQPLNSLTTKAFCRSAADLGLQVHPFYADDESEMKRLINCGVDGILTNYPHVLKRLLAD